MHTIRSPYTRRVLLRGAIASGTITAGTTLVGCARPPRAVPSAGPGTGNGGQVNGLAAPKTGGTVAFAYFANSDTLDPQRNTAASTNGPASAVMSRLFRFKISTDPNVSYDHDLENDLAISREVPDASTWTVKLRPGARFHNVSPVNGHAVEAEDIKATFTRAVGSPQNPNLAALDMVDANRIETPAKDTIVFKLNYPYAPFPNLLASAGFGEVFPREVTTNAYDPAKQLIGSGPFVFENYEPDVAINFKKNADWYEKGLPNADGARWAVIPNQAQIFAQFSAGNLTSADLQQRDLAAAQQSNPKAAVIKGTAGTPNVVYFQLGDPGSPFQDVRIRRAISMAIDRKAMANVLYNDQIQAYGFSVKTYFGKWALTAVDQLDKNTQQYYQYNPTEARQLLEAAGGASLQVRFAGAIRNPTEKAAQEMIFNWLKALPWKITLVQIDYNKDFIGNGKGYLYGSLPGDMVFVAGLSVVSDADQNLFRYYDSKNKASFTQLKDSALDQMIGKSRTFVNADERRKALLDVQKYIANKMYSVAGTPVGYQYTLVQPSVRNFLYLPEEDKGQQWARLWFDK